MYVFNETRKLILAGEAQLKDLVSDGVTEEQGNRSSALLVQGVLQITGSGVLA